MDVTKKERAQLRRLFSKACNEFDREEANLPSEEKVTNLRLIEEKARALFIVERYVRLSLLAKETDDKIIKEEIDESENYYDRWRLLEIKLNTLLNVQKEIPQVGVKTAGNTALIHYPKIKLPTFDGNIRNWLGFWGQFEKIDKDDSLDEHDKFSYLSQAMERGTSAEELIKSYPPGGASYKKALKQLQVRYGREELLIEIYVRDLLALITRKQTRGGCSSLRNLYDQLETKLRALETLGVAADKYAAMLYPLVESSLPNDTLRAWERFKNTLRRSKEGKVENNLVKQEYTSEEDISRRTGGKFSHEAELNSLLLFLQDEIEGEERIVIAAQGFSGQDHTYQSHTRKESGNVKREQRASVIPTAAGLLTSTNGNPKVCIFCSNIHKSADCNKANKMSLQERLAVVQQNRACFLCLREGHVATRCKQRELCAACGQRHHLFLCRTLTLARSNYKSKKDEGNTLKKDEIQIAGQDEALASLSGTPTVLLQTLAVILKGDNEKRKIRAIIDTASQRSYILRKTASEAGYKPVRKELLQHSLFGGSNTGTCEHDVYTVYLSNAVENYSCHFEVLSQPTICSTIPPVGKPWLEEIKEQNIQIVDQVDGPIEVLIGADVAGKLMTGVCKSLPGGLTAIQTKLGWTLMGKVPQSSRENSTLVAISMLTKDASIADLWSLDSLGITDPSEKKTRLELQEAAKQHFLSTVEINEQGRFVVHLPWLESHLPLPDHYALAVKRLESTVGKLKRDSLYKEYDEIFQDWVKEGIIEEVPQAEMDEPSHYLPHRHVVKEGSTTRVRPVFDASARDKNGPSLNDCLEKGPNTLELIPSLLTRFRLKKIGLTADIRRAFLQISLYKYDRNFLRFLWLNQEGILKQYRHCRVVFGVSCSPFLLEAVLKYHLQTTLDRYKEDKLIYSRDVLRELLSCFYVDNCVTSVENAEKLDKFVKQATSIMAERKFDLRSWEYTDELADPDTPTKVLGITWDRKNDTLGVNLSNWQDFCLNKITKRVILAAANRVFDPLGIVCPVTLLPKILLQRTWETNIGWDQEVDLGIQLEFKKWIDGLPYLDKLKIPRWLTGSGDSYELHVFCDASRAAYAVAVFVRVELEDSVKVQLLQARARVAPRGRQEISIPRLELLAATIAARLAATMAKDLPIKSIQFWTDSATVLAWLRRDTTWGVFVHNRIQEIKSLTETKSWRHVPGAMNPADLPSRGCSGRQLLSSKWWEGPDWLRLPPEEWPSLEFTVNEEEVSKERKKTIVSSLISITTNEVIGSYFSSYKKIVRMMGWVNRFIQNCKTVYRNYAESLSVQELDRAEKTVIRLVQQEVFAGLKDKRLATLSPFYDEGILKTKTGVFRREDSEEFRTPMILPGDHPIVKKLVLEEHQRRGHCGVSYVLNSLRERFWIICGRRLVRSVIRTCVICRRQQSRSVNIPTAPPPADRVQDAAVFQITGVDFAGPMRLRNREKVWICLYTCAVYRAVHLELVTSLSTETFLQAFHRFVARRGKPLTIYSDNGTNFVGAANAFALIDFGRVLRESSDERITWKFIPPGAPWWGGWWERLVGLMKQVLKKGLGQACLNYEEMNTVLCNCEAILNDRPLTVVNEDHTLTALTPACFLKELRHNMVPDVTLDLEAKGFRRRLCYLQTVRDSFRKRFRQEYLGLLQASRKRPAKNVTVKPGDVVLVGADDCKRISWPLGRIVELFPGADGISRRAKVKTQRGELVRALQSLYPLEVSSVDATHLHGRTDDLLEEVTPKEREQPDQKKTDSESEVRPVITRSGRAVKVPKKLL